MYKSILSNKEKLQDAVASSLSKAEVLRKMGLRPVGGNYKTLKQWIKKFGIDTEHFTGQGWNVGSKYRPIKVKKPLSDILKKDRPFNTHDLKMRLINEGVKSAICEKCKNTEWNGKPIPLELNHINGVNDDNRLENLEVICPNCHAQTKHYRGRSKKVGALVEKREVEYSKFRETLTCDGDGNPEPSFGITEKGAETLHCIPKSMIGKSTKINYCKKCKKTIKGRKKFCGIDCYKTYNASNVPTPGEIFAAFDEHKSFLQVGKHFGVSDNAVRKWCRKYQIMDMVKRKSRPQTSVEPEGN